MSDLYLYEYASVLERVLSYGVANKYSTHTVERLVSYSPFFQELEISATPFRPYITSEDLLKTLYGEHALEKSETPTFKQCLWASEAYLRIQMETRLTFEAIFLYLPLANMYELFTIYHEMDFSQIVDEFKSRQSKKSVLSILLESRRVSLTLLAEKTGISYDVLASVRSRRRSIQKLSVAQALSIASFFRVRVETVVEAQK